MVKPVPILGICFLRDRSFWMGSTKGAREKKMSQATIIVIVEHATPDPIVSIRYLREVWNNFLEM